MEPVLKKTPHEALLELPDHVIGEILDGELVVSPRPGPRQAAASSAIGYHLFGPYHRRPGGSGGPGGWWILDEPELHLGQQVMVPDLAGWRRGRLPRLPDEAYFTLPPDWVCEVVSPSTERIDRAGKKRLYAQEGVTWLWLVNPNARTLEVYRRGGEFWMHVAVYDGDVVVRAEPFGAVELDLARWWEDGSEPEAKGQDGPPMIVGSDIQTCRKMVG